MSDRSLSDRFDPLDRRRLRKIAGLDVAGLAAGPRGTAIDGPDRFRGPPPKQEA